MCHSLQITALLVEGCPQEAGLLLQFRSVVFEAIDLGLESGRHLFQLILCLPEVLAFCLLASFELDALLSPSILILLDVGKLRLQSLIVVFQAGDLPLKRGF